MLNYIQSIQTRFKNRLNIHDTRQEILYMLTSVCALFVFIFTHTTIYFIIGIISVIIVTFIIEQLYIFKNSSILNLFKTILNNFKLSKTRKKFIKRLTEYNTDKKFTLVYVSREIFDSFYAVKKHKRKYKLVHSVSTIRYDFKLIARIQLIVNDVKYLVTLDSDLKDFSYKFESGKYYLIKNIEDLYE